MKFFQITFFLLLTIQIYAQKIVGTISDSNGFLPNCNIVLKDKNDILKQFTKTDNRGFFKIDIENAKDSLFLEVSSIAYQSFVLDLSTIKPVSNTILINLKLEKNIT